MRRLLTKDLGLCLHHYGGRINVRKVSMVPKRELLIE